MVLRQCYSWSMDSSSAVEVTRRQRRVWSVVPWTPQTAALLDSVLATTPARPSMHSDSQQQTTGIQSLQTARRQTQYSGKERDQQPPEVNLSMSNQKPCPEHKIEHTEIKTDKVFSLAQNTTKKYTEIKIDGVFPVVSLLAFSV